MAAFQNMLDNVNEAVNDSFIGRYFEMKERKTNLTTELRGALATFLSTAYILAVNPRILGESGGPCVPPADSENPLWESEYLDCIEEVKRQWISATAIASMVGCLLMGLVANLPIALSVGMGMNAYFTYNVVGWRGTDDVEFKAAVTAVLVEGCIFLILAVTGVRYMIIKLLPEPVKLATPAAIGAFLAHLGLQTAEGIGVVVSDIATAVTLGACDEDHRTPIVALTQECFDNGGFDCITSDAYTCDNKGGIMKSGTAWLGIMGLLIIVILLAYRIRSAFVASIALVTVISWFRDTKVTYFPDTDVGDARFEYFQKIVSVESLDKVMFNYTSDFSDVGLALFTFLYVDFLDTSGTLLALANSLGFVDKDGDFPRSRQAFAVDAIATIFGSLFSLSPVTSFIESAAGVEAGSRTGLTAVFVAFFFFLSIFFSPILGSIPPWATGGALIVVGALMARSLAKVRWYDVTDATTAFITLMIMPLTYSIAYGLIGGIGCYVICKSVFKLLSFAGIPEPVFYPPPEDEDDDDGEEHAAAPKTLGENEDEAQKKEGPEDVDMETE